MCFYRCIAQLLGYAGINYSSPTLGTAMLNLVPAFTFVLAVIFRSNPLLMSLVLNIGAYITILLGKLSMYWKKPSLRLRIRVISLIWSMINTDVVSC